MIYCHKTQGLTQHISVRSRETTIQQIHQGVFRKKKFKDRMNIGDSSAFTSILNM